MRNRGTSSTIAGTASKARTAAKSRSRPGKRRRAKAYAAVALVPSWAKTVQPANRAVFTYKRASGRAASVPMASRMLNRLAEPPELQAHDREEEDGEDEGDHACVTQIQEPPPGLIGAVRQRVRAMQRPALRQQIDVSKDLRRAHQAGHEDEQRHRPQ